MRHLRGFLCMFAKGTSQAGMPAFQFGAARDGEKRAKRISHRGEKCLTKMAFYGILHAVKKKTLQEVCYAWFSLGAR